MSTDDQNLPRFDLRRAAFDKYSKYIFDACNAAETIVDPMQAANGVTGEPFAVNAHTFCCRLRDAILAQLRYHYSTFIDNSLLPHLRCFERIDGRVMIRNNMLVAKAKEAVAFDLSNKAHVLALVQRMQTQDEKAASLDFPCLPDLGERIVAWCEEAAASHPDITVTFSPSRNRVYFLRM